MRIRGNNNGFSRGSSLVEVTIALVVFAITVLGAAYYRYLTTLDVRRARDMLAGADLAMTFMETWQGTDGSETFDPENEFSAYMDISSSAGASTPDGYNLLDAYSVDVAGRTYHATLYWVDTESDLRELGTAVSWPDQRKTYQLTTYVRR